MTNLHFLPPPFWGPHPKIEPLARPSLLLFALKLTSYSRVSQPNSRPRGEERSRLSASGKVFPALYSPAISYLSLYSIA